MRRAEVVISKECGIDHFNFRPEVTPTCQYQVPSASALSGVYMAQGIPVSTRVPVFGNRELWDRRTLYLTVPAPAAGQSREGGLWSTDMPLRGKASSRGLGWIALMGSMGGGSGLLEGEGNVESRTDIPKEDDG